MEAKLKALLEAVSKKTASGGLTWKPFSDESFRTEVGTGSVQINRGYARLEVNGETVPAMYFTVQVSDELGRVVADTEATEGRSEAFEFLDQVFQTARRSAMRSDRLIDEMLQTLKASA